MNFTQAQLERYARHIVLPEVGASGQWALMQARVLVIGAGGLGSPLLLYLAAAGVGTLGVIDDDVVDASNLQRQVLHDTEALGRAKVESAAARIAALNPDVRVEAHHMRLTAENAAALFADYDLIADGSDSFATRYVVNEAAVVAGKTLVSGAIHRFDGQVATFKPHAGAFPCYRCLHPTPPPPGLIPSCAEGGVLGALAGAVGSVQAIEVAKELLGIGQSLAGRLWLYDALHAEVRTIAVPPDPDCPVCGA